MTTYLIIAGHGPQRNGTFDPGATGFITKGEHKLFRDDYFPMMKKYVTKNDTFIFYHERKVSNWGNLVQLVRQYNVDEVIELHFDAFPGSSSARGGHVIIHADYAPDDMDLRLRDAIEDMVGVRYSHRGHKGISGRSNLYNVNLARNNGIAYRLLELGFGTNQTDANIMTQQVDKYSRLLMEAITGAKVEASKPALTPSKRLGDSYTVKSGDTLSAIAKKYNTSVAELAKHNELSNPDLIRVGEDIEIPIAVTESKPAPKPSPKPKPQPATIAGARLVKNEDAYFLATENIKVRNQPTTKATHTGTLPKGASINYKRVFEGNGFRWLEYTGNSGNTLYLPYRRLSGDVRNWGTFHSERPQTKSIDEVAREILYSRNYGGWGTGETRRRKLREAGYDPAAVQRRINQLAK